ncbi:hypothetical protein BST38_22395 [Mycolicibacterium parafortuitum]|nr:hypothetical protein BST38_22395 [Mycolicibacterium parafortuitum]
MARARLDVAVIPEIPADIRPVDLAEAYHVSDRLAEELGWEIGGWYCAATNTSIQRLLNLEEPYCGRLFESLIFSSPAVLDPASFPPMMVEMEVAFRLGADLPARRAPYTRDEVADAVSHVAGSIEIVAGHLDDWMTQDAYSVIADNGTDGALVVGPEHGDWQSFDLAAVEVQVTRNGVVERRGAATNVLGDPLNAMTWLANARAGRGDGLRSGHIHNTGTLTSPLAVAPGDVLVADFGVLGDVRLELESQEGAR